MSEFSIEVQSTVKITVNDKDAIERVTGSGGDEWRQSLYDHIKTEQDVLEHFAFNAVANGITDASHLDGWADMQRNSVTMYVMDVDTV